jgi:TetR/AcrR family transcriptional regulator, transcriptional repressor for nem operon
MEAKSDRTRRFIIEKAASLFNRKGYHGTSMSDILQATGMAKGGIYGHFASKEEIVAEAFEHAFQRVMEELAVRVKGKTNAIDKLDAIVDFYSDFIDNPPIEGGCPILNYSGHTNDEVPAIAKLLARATRTMLDSLVRIIEKGQKYGQIKTEIQAEDYAEILYSRMEGALMLAKATKDGKRLVRLSEAVRRDIRRDLPI